MRIGTRGSALALAQARSVADQLQGAEIVTLTTSGDRGAPAADKSRWVDAIEDALLAREIDIAVHSAKDLPAELAAGLTLLGGPPRAAAEDALCGADDLEALAPGARVGTSSLRRGAQLRAARGDIELVALAGNVDTRLRKLERGDCRAIVLARAGLQRLAREDALGAVLDPARFVPAPGQGMLALEARSRDERARAAVAPILDPGASARLLAERALSRALDADCHTPLGAHATQANGHGLLLRAWVGLADGSAWICDELLGSSEDPQLLGARVAERMRAAGATELLSRAQETAAVAGA
jgi:hydroxymethylbilane synthase